MDLDPDSESDVGEAGERPKPPIDRSPKRGRTKSGGSSRAGNATKHGVDARTLAPIIRGPLFESEVMLRREVNRLTRAYAPRDAIEREHAHRLAVNAIQMDRLDQYEAYALGEGDQFRSVYAASGTPDPFTTVQTTEKLVALASGLASFDQVDCEQLALFVKSRHPSFRDVPFHWDSRHEPATASDWMLVMIFIRDQLWPKEKPAAFLEWATDQHNSAVVWANDEYEAERRRVARHAISTTLPHTIGLRGQLIRQRSALLIQYSLIQQRDQFSN